VPILLPVASVCISLILLAGVGTGIGLLSGLFGVGGGFLLTPLLIMTGVPATVAAASVSCQMIASSSSGVAAHFRLGNVDVKIGSVLLIGGLAGGGFGVEAIKILRTLGEANLTITLTYIVVLGALGSYMFTQSLRTLRHGSIAGKHRGAPRLGGMLSRLPWQMHFPRSGVRHSVLIPLVLAVLAGVLASVMGVGGGFIMLPLMVYMLGMPTHVAVGTSLFQILFLSAGITFMQADANHTVDLLLVLPLALSSAVGAQFGARLSRFLRGEQLMILLATLVLAVTGKMALNLISTPRNLITPVEAADNRGSMMSLEMGASPATGSPWTAFGSVSERATALGPEPTAGKPEYDLKPPASLCGRWMASAMAPAGALPGSPRQQRGGKHLKLNDQPKWADLDRGQTKGMAALRFRLPVRWPDLTAG
jgi:uncharacterized protein